MIPHGDATRNLKRDAEARGLTDLSGSVAVKAERIPMPSHGACLLTIDTPSLAGSDLEGEKQLFQRCLVRSHESLGLGNSCKRAQHPIHHLARGRRKMT